MPSQDSSDATQAEGEATDGSDKPKPHKSHSIPMPPKEAGQFEKQPGLTRSDLHQLNGTNGTTVVAPTSQHGGSESTASSPTVSDSEWGSAPSTRPPSRAPSMSEPKPKDFQPLTPAKTPSNAATTTVVRSTSTSSATQTKKKAPSVHSQDGGGSKFTLKDLLEKGPKLTRRSSQRSTGGSSRKSDSEAAGNARSVAGDSAVSLSQKYGVCAKIAIGKGATSVVRLAHKWDRTEEKLYAVKEFRKRRKNETEKEYVKKLTAEFCISSTLHHVNVVETVDLIQDDAQHWCEVMEFCPGGDLYAAIKKGGMSPSEVECCFRQILNGVAYLHSQGVAHRDIKPENLFFDTKGHLKIGDYGASTVYRLPWESTVHMSTGLCGSEPYIAPEQFLGKPYDARLVDVWACGIVYYCLHFQEIPWRAAQQTDSMYMAYANACTSPQPAVSACPPTINNLSPRTCRSLIRKMLEPDPSKRSDIEEVQRHAWVKSIEICHDVEKPKHVHVHAQAMAQAQLRAVD